MQQYTRTRLPCIIWGLGLNSLMWTELAGNLVKQDLQVLVFYLLAMSALTFKHLVKMGFARTLAGFGPAWVMCLLWLACLWTPKLYTQYRLPIVTAVRLVMGVVSMIATNEIRDQLYVSMLYKSPVFTVFSKIFLICNTAQIPIEAVRLQLPFMLQLLVTVFKSACLMCGGITTELVIFCNTPQYLAALEEMDAWWSTLLLGYSCPSVPRHSRLRGRSAAVLLCLAAIHISTIAITMDMVYASLWQQVLHWLQQQVRVRRAAPGSSNNSSSRNESNAHSNAIPLNGLAISCEQLQALNASMQADIMFDASGWRQHRAAAVALHAMLIVFLLKLSYLTAQLLVYQLLPRLLPDVLLDTYFPVTA